MQKTQNAALDAYIEDRELLVNMALRVVGDRMVAEDIVQDSWLRWDRHKYPTDRARPLFRSIVKNLAIDWKRSRAVEISYAQEYACFVENVPSSERAAIANDAVRRIVATLQRLPKRTVYAFKLRFIDGLTYREIGDELDLSLSRARALAEDAMIEISFAIA